MLLKMKKASEYCGLSIVTLRKYIDNGTIVGKRIGTYRYVDTSELDKWMGKTA